MEEPAPVITASEASIKSKPSFYHCLRSPSQWRFHKTFFVFHIVYFLTLAAVGTIVLLVSPKTTNEPITFVNALYMAVSALTVTGLMCVSMESLTYFDKIFLLLFSILGSHMFTSFLPLYIRRLKCQRRLAQRISQLKSSTADRCDTLRHNSPSSAAVSEPGRSPLGVIAADINDCQSLQLAVHISEPSELSSEFIDTISCTPHEHEANTCSVIRNLLSQSRSKTLKVRPEWERVTKYMRCIKAISKRIPSFTGKMADESDHCIDDNKLSRWTLEYEALTALRSVLVMYFIGVQFAGYLAIELALALSRPAVRLLQDRRINRSFFAWFSSISAFGNSGLPLLNDSMIQFRKSVPILLANCVLILMGNTMLAPCLRMTIWVLHRLQKSQRRRSVYAYLLDYPRSCYTHLFPQRHTLWLVAVVVALTTVQLLFFCSFDWNSLALNGLNTFQKFVSATFQSITTRNAGEVVVNLQQLSPPILILNLGLMYVSVYPVFLTRQNTIALGDTHDIGADTLIMRRHDHRISVQARKLLARDSTCLFLALLLICIIESKNITNDPLNYSVFNIMFEIVSAYGNVGLSIGYTCNLQILELNRACDDVPYSLSGKWSTAGKVVLVIVMMLGRHRGLPENMDSALKMPRIITAPGLMQSFNILGCNDISQGSRPNTTELLQNARDGSATIREVQDGTATE